MNFKSNWNFAERHLPSIQQKLQQLPAGVFLDFQTAEMQKDYEEATDLILRVAGGTMAVRVRSRKHWELGAKYGFDWSVRYKIGRHKTEIHKLREGFADWYFYAYSADGRGELQAWWLIDLDAVRNKDILNSNKIGDEWPINDNHDGTHGLYIPIKALDGCIIHCEYGSYTNARIKQPALDDSQLRFFDDAT